MNTPHRTPADWYGDPSGSNRLRYWDGQQWTDQFAYKAVEPTTAPSAPTVEIAGMSATTKIAWIMAILAALSIFLVQVVEGQAEIVGWVLVEMAFGAVVWFGIVILVGWVILKVRVALSRAGPPAPATPVDPVATPAPTGQDDYATIEASLRRLKALHDEGILTDDEYETKRKALTEQL